MTGAEARGIALVKVGGSLLEWDGLPRALQGFLRAQEPARRVLVVGGGKVVDALRSLDSVHRFGDNQAHDLALRALEVTAQVVARLICGARVIQKPDELEPAWTAGVVPILAPWWWMEHVDSRLPDPLPRVWAATSDSIAARLARELGAESLTLLKSTWPGGRSLPREEAGRIGLVDPVFSAASAHLEHIEVVDLRGPGMPRGILT